MGYRSQAGAKQVERSTGFPVHDLAAWVGYAPDGAQAAAFSAAAMSQSGVGSVG